MVEDPYLDAVQAAQNGDMEAFESLVRAFSSPLYNYCARMIGGTADAEDVTQEVFLKAYRALPTFRGTCKFSTWLFRICNNACIDYIRKVKNTPLSLHALQSRSAGEAAPWEPPVPESELPDQQLMRDERWAYICASLEALPDKYRSVLLLRDRYDHSYQEIADILQLPLNTVRSRLKRGRAMLASKILLWEGGNRA